VDARTGKDAIDLYVLVD